MSVHRALLALSLALVLASTAGAQPSALFAPGPALGDARLAHGAELLPDGRVVLFGGHGTGFVSLQSAEIWTPATNRFTKLTMCDPRDVPALALLGDGRFLLAGGSADLGVPSYSSAEIYDPASGTFTATGSMSRSRASGGAATLRDGRVLIAGSWYDSGGAICELYDPGSGTFSQTGPLTTPRANNLVFATDDGKAVVLGGSPVFGGPPIESVELFEPTSSSFSQIQPGLIPNETGWSVMMYNGPRTPEQRRMADGRYLMLASRAAAQITSYALVVFDPARRALSRIDTQPPLSPYTLPGGLVVDAARSKAYVFKVTANPPYKMFLQIVDLPTGQLTEASGNFTFPGTTHPGYAGFTLLEDGRILITGGHEGCANPNFCPAPDTLLVTIEGLGVSFPISGGVPAVSGWLPRGGPPPSARYAQSVYDTARGVTVLYGGLSNGPDHLSDTWEWDGLSWSQRDVTGPAGRVFHAMAYDAQRRKTVLFGGENAPASALGDTWEYDGTAWSRLSPATAPQPRQDHSMTYDAARGRVIVFGGASPLSRSVYNDTWEWDGTRWSQNTVTTAPSPRYEAAMAYDAKRGAVLLFGGGPDLDHPTAETWAYDGRSWTRLAPALSPPALMGHTMTWDPHRRVVRLFGGHTARVPAAPVVWEWDGTVWSQTAPTGPQPFSRYAAAFSHDSSRGRTVMFGGFSAQGPGLCKDTWEWDGYGWLPRLPAMSVAPSDFPTSPPAREGHAMAADPTSQAPVMFGGSNGTELSDTWQWLMTSWTKANPPISPDPRHSHAMAPDGGTGILMFGGASSVGLLGDTWIWRQGSWNLQQPMSSPAGRRWHAMASDPVRGGVLLFGGLSGGTGTNDTWHWNGTDWSIATSPSAPPARHLHAMAADSRRQKVVLFGGIAALNGLPQNDTWEWNGTDWTNVSLANSPPARAGASLTYDAWNEVCVLHGGNNTDGPLDDAWSWDGTVWEQLDGPSALVPRENFAMVYDPAGARLLVFGGRSGSVLLGDTGNLVRPKEPITATYSPANPVPGDVVTLRAQASGGTPAHFRWQQIYGPPALFSAQFMPVVTFVAGAPGVVGVEVAWGDFYDSRVFAQAEIRISEGAGPPVARMTIFGADNGPSQVVRLDGSSSSGGSLSYAWSLDRAPAAAAELSAAGPIAFYRAGPRGTYAFRLRVTDSLGRSASATGSITIAGAPPVARVVAPASIVLPDPAGQIPVERTTDSVRLDGSGSFDPASTSPVAYLWSLVSAPAGSSVSGSFAALDRSVPILRVPFGVTPSGGRLPDAGSYVFGLTVTGRDGSSSTRAELVAVDPANLIARADAGPDQTVFLTVESTAPLRLAPTVPDPRLRPPGNLRPYVTLDGRSSGRAGSGALTYAWSVVAAPAGSGIALSGAASALPTFATAVPGDYAFGLVVDDGATHSPMDVTTVHVTITGVNSPPAAEVLVREAVTGRQARPGLAFDVVAGRDVVELDATRSTDRDDPPPLAYRWRQVAGQPVELIPSPTASRARFLPPGPDGYEFELLARDPHGVDSAPALARVNARSAGKSPFGFSIVASASTTAVTGSGFDPAEPPARPRSLRVVLPSVVTLTAVSSSPDRTQAIFTWRQLEGPPVALVPAAGGLSAIEVRPTTARLLVFEAQAWLPESGSVRRQVRVVADTPARTLPAAAFTLSADGRRKAFFKAGVQTAAAAVDPGSVVTLDGSASSDPDTPASQLSYLWVQTAGPAVQLSNAASVVTTFVVPSLSDNSSHRYSFLLYVDDGDRGEPAAGSFDAVSSRGLLLERGCDWIAVPVNPSTTGHAYDASDLLHATGASAVARVVSGRFEVYHAGLQRAPFAIEGNRGYALIGATASLVDFEGPSWSIRQVQLTPGLNSIAYPPPIPAGAGTEWMLSNSGATWLVSPGAQNAMNPYMPSWTTAWQVRPGRAWLVVVSEARTLNLPAGP